MANESLNSKVTIEARPINVRDLPDSFSFPLTDWILNQNVDLENVAGQANNAAAGAFEAQEVNDKQNALLAEQEQSISNLNVSVGQIFDSLNGISSQLENLDNRVSDNTNKIADHELRISANELAIIDLDSRVTDIEYAITRKKSEVVYTSQSLVIPTTPVNLVTILKALTPSEGTLAPFFDTTLDKLVVYNENKSVNFKLILAGSWASGSANRSMSLNFTGTVPDTINDIRYPGVATDSVFFATFFSVDVDGFLATNGSTLTIQSNGSDFTANTIKIIAEQ